METTHRVHIGDSRQLAEVEDDTVELVVTSPPYPMIEMWDEVFTALNSAIGNQLARGAGEEAFQAMHRELDNTWRELKRVLTPGGIACINIGDATRKLDDEFRVFSNHARIIRSFDELGFVPLPDILWRKPVNSAAKFMGSGMLPPNAYVTLEHEYILIFRNAGGQRSFEPGDQQRYESAYFWEERNEWFSDVWFDITGTLQTLENDELRDRSAAFPFEIPYRLINMYSVYGDTVLDPFWGTGTTSLAAMAAGRNSVGYEREAEFATVFEDQVSKIRDITRDVLGERITRHREFVRDRRAKNETFEYTAERYDFPVMTKQERQLTFYSIAGIDEVDAGYRLSHERVETPENLRTSSG